MGSSASLIIGNNLDELSRLGEWVNAWAQQHTIADATAGYVDLCATEAVTNIMTHAFADSGAHEITLQLDDLGDRVKLQIEDDGIAFDPTTAPPREPATLDSGQVGGWGIRIVRRLTDDVQYHRVNGRNRLTLVFRQRPQAAA